MKSVKTKARNRAIAIFLMLPFVAYLIIINASTKYLDASFELLGIRLVQFIGIMFFVSALIGVLLFLFSPQSVIYRFLTGDKEK